MSYWYPENRPEKQFAAVFDTNKCIACQTCTLACKTTWTSGAGQEYMLWNNVETKPYGFYPLSWDLKLPPIHVPLPFTRQMFGPGVEDAVKTYLNAANDPDLTGLLALFGSSEMIMPRWKRQGDWVTGMSETGSEIVRVPLKEPVHVRPAYDRLYQISRVNCP
jgi:ferredoxin